MEKFQSNADVFTYLTALGTALEGAGATELAKNIKFAAAQRFGMSTEFLGESLIALKNVLACENGRLSAQQRADLAQAVAQLRAAFDRR